MEEAKKLKEKMELEKRQNLLLELEGNYFTNELTRAYLSLHVNLAYAYFEAQNWEKSKETIDSILKMDTTDPFFVSYLQNILIITLKGYLR